MKKSQEGLKVFSQNATTQLRDEAEGWKGSASESQLKVQHTLMVLDIPFHLLAMSDFTIC